MGAQGARRRGEQGVVGASGRGTGRAACRRARRQNRRAGARRHVGGAHGPDVRGCGQGVGVR